MPTMMFHVQGVTQGVQGRKHCLWTHPRRTSLGDALEPANGIVRLTSCRQ